MYVCSKLTIKASEWKRRSGVFIVNFEHISHLFQMFFFFADFEQVNIIAGFLVWLRDIFRPCQTNMMEPFVRK